MRAPWLYLVCVVAVIAAIAPAAGQGQSSPPPTAPPPVRPNVRERPWTTTPGSPYDRAQAVAAERVPPVAPSIDFPVVEAPPAELGAASPVAGRASTSATPNPARPSVSERPWTSDEQSLYGRAQKVAAERLAPQGMVNGSSPYPDEYRSAVPAPFQPRATNSYGRWSDGFMFYQGRPVAPGWRGPRIYPALPFRPIQIR